MFIIEFPNAGFYKQSYDCLHGNMGSRDQAKVWKTREAAERNASRLRAGYSTTYRSAVVVEAT